MSVHSATIAVLELSWFSPNAHCLSPKCVVPDRWLAKQTDAASMSQRLVIANAPPFSELGSIHSLLYLPSCLPLIQCLPACRIYLHLIQLAWNAHVFPVSLIVVRTTSQKWVGSYLVSNKCWHLVAITCQWVDLQWTIYLSTQLIHAVI